MTQNNPEERLRILIDKIAEATTDVRNYDIPDLSHLETQAMELCNEIKNLPPEHAKTMESEILRMISGLESLSTALETIQENMTAQLQGKEE